MNNFWTDEQIQKLTMYWREGKTAAQIARLIRGKSRNAIIGKAHRLKLDKRDNPLVTIKLKNGAKFPAERIVKKHHLTVKKEERLARASEINEKIFGPGRAMIDLKPSECRWPVGKVFCSAKTENHVYCNQHRSIAYVRQDQNISDV